MGGWEKLQALHLDALKEIGNIGVGNAATSLAQMIGKKIDMEVPEAAVSDINGIIHLVGNAEDLVVCINLQVQGDAPSNVFFILKHDSALQLAERLLGISDGGLTEINEYAESALQEIGNILTGSIINALGSMTGLDMKSSVPAFANDMLGAVISAALLERGYFDERVLIIETKLMDEEIEIEGYFFLLPEEKSLEKIFESLGITL